MKNDKETFENEKNEEKEKNFKLNMLTITCCMIAMLICVFVTIIY